MGILFAFLTALATAAFNVLIRKGMNRTNGQNKGYLITVVINVIVQGLIFLIVYTVRGFTFQFSWAALILFMLAGILSTIIGRLALFSAIHQINPSRASALKNSAPVFTVLFALLVLNEHLTPVSIIGLLLVFGAIFIQGLMNFRQSRHNQEDKEENRANWTGYLIAIFAAFLFGMGQGIRKQGLLIVDEPFLGAWVGSLTALVSIILYQGLKGQLKTVVQQNWRILNPYFIFAGIFISFGPLCFFLGASFMQVSYVSVIAAVEPLITILLSIFLLKGQEKLTVSVWFSAVLVLAGTVFIALET